MPTTALLWQPSQPPSPPAGPPTSPPAAPGDPTASAPGDPGANAPASTGFRLDGTNIKARWENGVLTITREDGTEQVVAVNPADMIPPQVPVIIGTAFTGIIGLILAFPIGRAIARWIDRRGVVAPTDPQLANRLAAIEQAVDTVAIEMERLSEANRFTTRLLSERVSAPDFAAGARAGEHVAERASAAPPRP